MEFRNVLVTGATRGLGLAIARRLLDEKYHILATGRKISLDLEELISESRHHQGSITFHKLDLSDLSILHPFINMIIK
ncbi:unnamed protein product, partial [marine sediment metagenome]